MTKSRRMFLSRVDDHIQRLDRCNTDCDRLNGRGQCIVVAAQHSSGKTFLQQIWANWVAIWDVDWAQLSLVHMCTVLVLAT
eukprot:m51a1_g6453 hypothetical protein (81) ;mRNA; f:442042-446148